MGSVLAGITIVFTVAWLATALLRRASAAMRHLIWTCAFVAVLLLAPLRWRLPHREIAPPLTAIATTIVATTAVAATGGADNPQIDPMPTLFTLWAMGTVVMTIRLLRNAIRLRSIMKNARGRFPIFTSSEIRGPVVAGLFRPVILLPEASKTWTVGRRRAVFAHEAAHIRRRDPAVLLAAHITTAVYWFHPLCWLAAARLRAESERACDDAALRIGLLPSGYAGHLLDLACRFDTQLAIPMATTSHLESRVKSILDPMTNRSFPARAAWFGAAVLTAAILAPLTTFTLKGQQTAAGTSVITGTVTDPTGARVPRAKVTATNSDLDWSGVTTSNEVGIYSFANIPGGHYSIETQSPGFARFQAQNLALVSGAKLQVDPRLSVGNITQAMTVSAQGTPKPQPMPTAKAAAPGPIRVGGNVQAASLIRQPRAVYPADLQAQGIEGTVMLQAIISKDGVPHSLRVINGAVNQAFVDAAIEAVSQWRYKPTLLNGEPIEVMTSIDVDFKLKQ